MKKIKILIGRSDYKNRRAIKKLLTAAGYAIEEGITFFGFAVSGEEVNSYAVRTLLAKYPDLEYRA